jgi:hypothetical protein
LLIIEKAVVDLWIDVGHPTKSKLESLNTYREGQKWCIGVTFALFKTDDDE